MKLLVAAICDDATAEGDGKLTLTGVFHDLYAPGFPAKQDRMVLVLVLEWAREDQGHYDFKADLMGPDGTPTLSVQGQSQVERRPRDRPPARTQIVMPMEEVVFPSSKRTRRTPLSPADGTGNHPE